MSNYIDGFVFPLPLKHVEEYQKVALQVAEIWKEYGALEYHEFIGDDLDLEGIQSFTDAVPITKDEVIVFGWVVFPSKEIRDLANKKVPQDPRMTQLVQPLMKPTQPIFNARRMVYGGFKSFISS